jgi:hypothetical protein
MYPELIKHLQTLLENAHLYESLDFFQSGIPQSVFVSCATLLDHYWQFHNMQSHWRGDTAAAYLYGSLHTEVTVLIIAPVPVDLPTPELTGIPEIDWATFLTSGILKLFLHFSLWPASFNTLRRLYLWLMQTNQQQYSWWRQPAKWIWNKFFTRPAPYPLPDDRDLRKIVLELLLKRLSNKEDYQRYAGRAAAILFDDILVFYTHPYRVFAAGGKPIWKPFILRGTQKKTWWVWDLLSKVTITSVPGPRGGVSVGIELKHLLEIHWRICDIINKTR